MLYLGLVRLLVVRQRRHLRQTLEAVESVARDDGNGGRNIGGKTLDGFHALGRKADAAPCSAARVGPDMHEDAGPRVPADIGRIADQQATAVLRGKGGRRREVGMGAWGREQLNAWLDMRRELPVGPLLCVINGTTRGRHWSSAAARAELRRTAAVAGVRRRFAPHHLRQRTRRDG